MSAQSVLFDAPGPKARARHNVLTAVGALLIVGVSVLPILWTVHKERQLAKSKA